MSRVILIACLVSVLACHPAEVTGPFTTWTDPVSSALRRGLRGLDAQEGAFVVLDHAGCGPIVERGDSCFGAHPASPYVMAHLPDPTAAPATEIVDYQLDPEEAIVFVGLTPPASRYWSFNHHQYRKALPDGGETITFGTLAPSMHMLNTSTAGDVLAPGARRSAADLPFRDFTVVVFTANQSTASRIEEALGPELVDAGYDPGVLNVHTMAYADTEDAAAMIGAGADPEEVFSLSMGHGSGADTFNLVLRIAALEDAGTDYLDPARIPAAVFRVRPSDVPSYDPFPWPVFPPEDDTGERQPAVLAEAQRQVLDAIAMHLVPDGLEARELVAPRRAQKSGARCINELEVCGANNDDARYHRTEQRMIVPDPAGVASVFVVGVNHTHVASLAANAPQVTYTSLTLNNFSRGFGVVTRLDHELEGSLDFWLDASDLPADFPLRGDELDSVYVLQFARDCSRFRWAERYGRPNPYCVEFEDALLGVCPQDKLWFTERVYLNQTSGTAPAASSVLPPVALAVAPTIRWTDQGSQAGNGGAWLLGDVPRPTPSPAPWCDR